MRLRRRRGRSKQRSRIAKQNSLDQPATASTPATAAAFSRIFSRARSKYNMTFDDGEIVEGAHDSCQHADHREHLEARALTGGEEHVELGEEAPRAGGMREREQSASQKNAMSAAVRANPARSLMFSTINAVAPHRQNAG